MNPRVEYKMTEQDHEDLLEACKSVPYMIVGTSIPSSPQENANRAWAILGKKMGFDSMSVRPSDKGELFFTAIPSETDAQKSDRMKREAKKEKKKKVSHLKAEIKDLIQQLAILDIRTFKDGDKWCATWSDFINLQKSPAGFGDTKEEAIENLTEEM